MSNRPYRIIAELLEDPFEDPFAGDNEFGDPFDAGADDQSATMLPNVTLSATEQAILALIAAYEAAVGVAKEKIEHSPNAREGLKRLIRVGAVESDAAGYRLTEIGSELATNLGLVDDGGVTDSGKRLALQHFTL